MNTKLTKIIMTVTALFTGLVGITCSFLPQEIIRYFSEVPETFPILITQFYGAAALGFAINLWMIRSNKIGGIYNRPLAMGCTLHFIMIAIALIKFVLNQEIADSHLLLLLTVCYSFFALLFLKITFTTPKLS